MRIRIQSYLDEDLYRDVMTAKKWWARKTGRPLSEVNDSEFFRYLIRLGLQQLPKIALRP